MELKEYQARVVNSLSIYLEQLESQFTEKSEYYKFQQEKGKKVTHPEESDYCNLAWDETKKIISVSTANYSVRRDGIDRNIIYTAICILRKSMIGVILMSLANRTIYV